MVTAADHHCIRQLLAAHGAPLPPAPAASADAASPFLLRSTAADGAGSLAGGSGGGAAGAAAAAAAAAAAGGPAPHCHEFVSHNEGLRYCEQELLAVAVRCGLCRPPSEGVTLDQLLRAHARWALRGPTPACTGRERAACVGWPGAGLSAHHTHLVRQLCTWICTPVSATPRIARSKPGHQLAVSARALEPPCLPCRTTRAARRGCPLPARRSAARRRRRSADSAAGCACGREMLCGGRATPRTSCT